MTFDFQLGHQCPHLTIEEQVILGSDRRSLLTRQPVASASQIQVTANDNTLIQKEGTYTSALLSSGVSGPYRVSPKLNELTVSNRLHTVTVQLLENQSLTTDSIVNLLNKAFNNAQAKMIAGNANGVLRIRDQLEQGRVSRLRVSGTALTALGFQNQFQARGREVYPPWDFAERDVIDVAPGLGSVRPISTRYPKFTKPVKSNPIFKVTYTTYQKHCRRCLTYDIENDYRILASGEPATVINEDLLNQDVLKILTTIRGSNPFHPRYGSTILNRIGTKAVVGTVSSINEDVAVTLDIFKRLQTEKARYQQVTPREKLAALTSLQTRPSEFDPTIFEVDIVATNASNIPVSITTVFAAPGTAALAGTNGLSLGLSGFGLDPLTRTLPGLAG